MPTGISVVTRELLAELIGRVGTYARVCEAFEQVSLPPPLPEGRQTIRTRASVRQVVSNYLQTVDWSDQELTGKIFQVCREGLKKYTWTGTPLALDADTDLLMSNPNIVRARTVLERNGYTIDDTLSIVPLDEPVHGAPVGGQMPVSAAALSSSVPSAPGLQAAVDDAAQISLHVLATLGVQEAPPPELSNGETTRWQMRRAARELLAHPSYRAAVDDATATTFGHLTAAAISATETVDPRLTPPSPVESALVTSMNHYAITAWNQAATAALNITGGSSPPSTPR